MGGFLVRYLLMFICLLMILLSSFLESSFPPSSCKLQNKFNLNGIHRPGDVILGGLFEVHYSSVFPEWTFTSEPDQPNCRG